MFNKNRMTKINDKKVLHKVKKQWVTISVALLGAVGMGISTVWSNAHAANHNEPAQTNLNNNFNNRITDTHLSKMGINKNINQQANLLHQHILKNANLIQSNHNYDAVPNQAIKSPSNVNNFKAVNNSPRISASIHNNQIKATQNTLKSNSSQIWSNLTWGTSPVTVNGNTDTISVGKGTIGSDIIGKDGILIHGSHANNMIDAEQKNYVTPFDNRPGDFSNVLVNLPNDNKDWKIIFSDTAAPADSSNLFNCEGSMGVVSDNSVLLLPSVLNSQIKSINTSGLNTSNVTNMESMFADNNNLQSLNLSNFNTKNVTNMGNMFASDHNLPSLDLSNFDTSNVNDMFYMFSRDENLKSLKLDNFDTNNVTDMAGMFYNDRNLQALNLAHFNTSDVIDMGNMFNKDISLRSLNLDNFNTQNVTNMEFMFSGDQSLQSLSLAHFNTRNVTNMESMFAADRQLQALNLNNFDTSNVANMGNMFSGDQSIPSLDLSSFNTGKVSNTAPKNYTINYGMSGMFAGCGSLKSIIFGSGFNTNGVYKKLLKNNADAQNNMFGHNSDQQLAKIVINSSETKFDGKSGLPTLYKKVGQDEDGNAYTMSTPNDFNTGNIGTFVLHKNVPLGSSQVWSNLTWGTAPVTINGNTDTITIGKGTVGSNIVGNNGIIIHGKHYRNMKDAHQAGLDQIYNAKDVLINLPNDKKDWQIKFANGVILPPNCTNLLSGSNNVNGMTYNFMHFQVNAIDIQNVNISQVTNMADLFSNDGVLKSVLMNNWNTSSVNNMSQMFTNDNNLSTLGLGAYTNLDKNGQDWGALFFQSNKDSKNQDSTQWIKGGRQPAGIYTGQLLPNQIKSDIAADQAKESADVSRELSDVSAEINIYDLEHAEYREKLSNHPVSSNSTYQSKVSSASADDRNDLADYSKDADNLNRLSELLDSVGTQAHPANSSIVDSPDSGMDDKLKLTSSVSTNSHPANFSSWANDKYQAQQVNSLQNNNSSAQQFITSNESAIGSMVKSTSVLASSANSVNGSSNNASLIKSYAINNQNLNHSGQSLNYVYGNHEKVFANEWQSASSMNAMASSANSIANSASAISSDPSASLVAGSAGVQADVKEAQANYHLDRTLSENSLVNSVANQIARDASQANDNYQQAKQLRVKPNHPTPKPTLASIRLTYINQNHQSWVRNVVGKIGQSGSDVTKLSGADLPIGYHVNSNQRVSYQMTNNPLNMTIPITGNLVSGTVKVIINKINHQGRTISSLKEVPVSGLVGDYYDIRPSDYLPNGYHQGNNNQLVRRKFSAKETRQPIISYDYVENSQRPAQSSTLTRQVKIPVYVNKVITGVQVISITGKVGQKIDLNRHMASDKPGKTKSATGFVKVDKDDDVVHGQFDYVNIPAPQPTPQPSPSPKPQSPTIIRTVQIPVYIDNKSNGYQAVEISGKVGNHVQLTNQMAADKNDKIKSAVGFVTVYKDHDAVHGQFNYRSAPAPQPTPQQPQVITRDVQVPVYVNNRSNGYQTVRISGKIGSRVPLVNDMALNKGQDSKSVTGFVSVDKNSDAVHGQFNYTSKPVPSHPQQPQVVARHVQVPVYINNRLSGAQLVIVSGTVGSKVQLTNRMAADKAGDTKSVTGFVTIGKDRDTVQGRFNYTRLPAPHPQSDQNITRLVQIPVYINGQASGFQPTEISGIPGRSVPLTNGMAADKNGDVKSASGWVTVGKNSDAVDGQFNYTSVPQPRPSNSPSGNNSGQPTRIGVIDIIYTTEDGDVIKSIAKRALAGTKFSISHYINKVPNGYRFNHVISGISVTRFNNQVQYVNINLAPNEAPASNNNYNSESNGDPNANANNGNVMPSLSSSNVNKKASSGVSSNPSHASQASNSNDSVSASSNASSSSSANSNKNYSSSASNELSHKGHSISSKPRSNAFGRTGYSKNNDGDNSSNYKLPQTGNSNPERILIFALAALSLQMEGLDLILKKKHRKN